MELVIFTPWSKVRNVIIMKKREDVYPLKPLPGVCSEPFQLLVGGKIISSDLKR